MLAMSSLGEAQGMSQMKKSPVFAGVFAGTDAPAACPTALCPMKRWFRFLSWFQ